MSEAVLALKFIYAKNKNLFLFALKVIIAAVILVLIFDKIDTREIINIFSLGNTNFILFAFGLSFLNLFLQYLKWETVCNSFLQEYDRRKIIKSLFYGFSLGAFTPARSGEYAGRAVPLSHLPFPKVAYAVFIDKLFSLFIVLIPGLLCYLLYLDFSPAASAGITIAAVLFFYSILNGIKKSLSLLPVKWIQKLLTGLSYLRNIDTALKLRLLILSVLFYACFILQFGLLISAFTPGSSFINQLWISGLVMFTKTIIPPVSVGELGVREGLSVYFVKQFGGTAEAGLNASALLFVFNILLPAITGLVIYLRKK